MSQHCHADVTFYAGDCTSSDLEQGNTDNGKTTVNVPFCKCVTVTVGFKVCNPLAGPKTAIWS